MSAATSYRVGGIYGIPFMRFTLTYDGSLPASANKPKNEDKWRIRKDFHPQIIDLWASHPALRHIELNERYFPKEHGASLRQRHHTDPGPLLPVEDRKTRAQGGDLDILDLCESIEKHGAWFKPLVRQSFALHCGLKITFLRKEPPGNVYQGGDLDSRIKTLLDALAMPQHVEQVLEKSSTRYAPIYCLLEDDSLVSACQ
jgi:hypothetical protein